MMPKVHEIEVPLLQALHSLGGKALAKDVYPVVTKESGAAPVILFGGDQVAQIMIEKGIGIRSRPVEIYEDQIENLFEK